MPRHRRNACPSFLLIPLLEEAYAASEKHPRLRWVAVHLLDAYVQAGRPAEDVTRLVAPVLEDIRRPLPKDSPQLAGLLEHVSLLLLRVKAAAEAEPLLRECLAILEKAEPDAWTTFNTQSLLGWALLGQENYAEAEPLLLKGYEGMKAREEMIPQQGHVRIPEAIDRLIELYAATDKPDEVKKWQAERGKYSVEEPPLLREKK